MSKSPLSQAGKRRVRYNVPFNDDLINGNPYLKENIQKVEDHLKFLCLPCKKVYNRKKPLLFEGLSGHLQTLTHEKTAVTKENEEMLASANQYLAGNPQRVEDAIDGIQIEEEDEERILAEEEKTNDLIIQSNKDSEPLIKANNQFYFRFQITNFLINHNLSFSLSDKLLDFFKNLLNLHHPQSIQNFKLNPKHVHRIASACIGPSLKEKYLELLKKTYFSISLDEGSIKGNIEYLAISARFFETEEAERTTTKLLGLLQLDGCAKGQTLYDLVENFLFSGVAGKERKKHLLGVSTDHASNMISKKDKGLTNRLAADVKHIVVVHDICHALNLVLKECIENFPGESQDIVRNIASMFSRSPHHAAKFKHLLEKEGNTEGSVSEEKKEEIKGNVRTILRYIETRWSSFHDALKRIVELAVPLQKYINLESNPGSKKREYLKDDNFIMMKLLLCLIGLINDYIKEFQRDNLSMIEIVDLIKECQLLFAEYMFDLPKQHQIDFDGRAFKDYNKLYEILSPLLLSNDENLTNSYKRTSQEFSEYFLLKHSEFNSLLSKIQDEKVKKEFFEAAFKFFETAFDGIRKRLPAPNSVLFMTECFQMKDQSCPDKIKEIAAKFENVIADKLGDFNKEANKLGYHVKTINENIGKFGFLEAWKMEKSRYPQTYKLLRAIETLPYSSVSIERAFSTATDIKTLKRNRLSVESLESCLLVKQNFSDDIPFTPDLGEKYEKSIQEEILRQKERQLQKQKSLDLQSETKEDTIPSDSSSTGKMLVEREPLIDFEPKNLMKSNAIFSFDSEEAFLQAAERVRFNKYLQEYRRSEEIPFFKRPDNLKRNPSTPADNPVLKKTKKTPLNLENTKNLEDSMELEDNDSTS